MFNYIPERFAPETADTVEEADRWLNGDKNARRPPELLTRDVVARAITRRGQGRPRLAARRRVPRHRVAPARRLHQAQAAVDVPPVQGAGRGRHHQASRWRSARRCTTSWAAIRVDADTQRRRRCRACSPAASARAGLHGANRLGGNSLSDLIVFGKLAGARRRDLRRGTSSTTPKADDEQIARGVPPRDRAAQPRRPATNPYLLHDELAGRDGLDVGIVRTADELEQAIERARGRSSRRA